MKKLTYKILLLIICMILNFGSGFAIENRSYITKQPTQVSGSKATVRVDGGSAVKYSNKTPQVSTPVGNKPIPYPTPELGTRPPSRPHFPFVPPAIYSQDSQTGKIKYYPVHYYGYYPVSTRTTTFSSGNSSFSYSEEYIPRGSYGHTVIRFR